MTQSTATRMKEMIKKVRSKHPHAGAMLSAMWGWQIIDYGPGGYGNTILGRARRSEYDAWASAARNLLQRTWRKP